MAKKTTKKSAKTQPTTKPAAKRRARSTKAKAADYEEGAKALVDAAKKKAVEDDRVETDIFLRNQNTPAAQSVLMLLREHWAGGA